jgi:hypothetical protein
MPLFLLRGGWELFVFPSVIKAKVMRSCVLKWMMCVNGLFVCYRKVLTISSPKPTFVKMTFEQGLPVPGYSTSQTGCLHLGIALQGGPMFLLGN